ncbi:tyrosine-type recombinase/integrase [Streptomyces sp. PTD5-9]|uniref:tyrosine-type recombinase/integrase n=1 Tax=Streptomyces sp. PTD5-9 TaxID=3120150 RepID=UPI003008AFFF
MRCDESEANSKPAQCASQALQRVGGELLIVAPKNQRSAHRVALPAECMTALRAQQIADRKAAGANRKETGQDLVLTTKNGTPIEPRNLNRSFETLCTRAGVRKVHFHDLRHTCASLLHEQGADARMIKEVLGHSSIRVTVDIYTFVRLDSQRSAFDRVGDALRGDGNRPDDDDGAAGVLVAVQSALHSPAEAVAVKRCHQGKSQRPCGSLHRASGLLGTQQDSNLQPSDP